jgi:parallel beta-helix repeat protein
LALRYFKRHFQVLFVFHLLFSFQYSGISFALASIEYANQVKQDKKEKKSESSPHQVDEPISINGNDDFVRLGFPGSGTDVDPYRIENLTISGNTETLISLTNTNAFCTIRNNTLEGQSSEWIIYIDSVENVIIENNTIRNGGGEGITMYQSENNIIRNNSIYGNNRGLLIELSPHNNIIENRIYENIRWGIQMLESSNFNLLFNNSITQNGIGIITSSSHSLQISNNIISNNDAVGMDMHSSSNTNISFNTVIGNQALGIIARGGSSNLRIVGNQVNQNGAEGLILSNCDHATIANNYITQNAMYGILLENSNHNLIFRNQFEQNFNHGVHLAYSDSNNTVFENNFLNNNLGFSQAYAENENNFEFNYWSDWLVPDSDNNAIIDEPYAIEGGNNLDRFPVLYEYDISVQSNLEIPEINQVVIDGNDALHEFALEEEIGGNGTISHPYMIENWTITDNTLEWVFNNTDLHFEITNYSFIKIYRIYFQNVTNAKITCNNFSDVTLGIIIINSSGVEISNNTISLSSSDGISLQNSVNSRIHDNSISLSNNGIYLSDSRNNTINNNILSNNLEYGLFVRASPENRITNNSFVNCIMHIRGNLHALQNEVANNTINSREILYLQNITNKVISGNPGQIILINSKSIEITGLELFGLSVRFCTNVYIHNNTIFGTLFSNVGIVYSDNSTLHNNWIYQGLGIFNGWSQNTVISSNVIMENTDSGVAVISSVNTIIRDNHISNNGNAGIYLQQTLNCIIHNNSLIENANDGIRSADSLNTDFTNNVLENNAQNGIYLTNSTNVYFSENELTHNQQFGIFFSNSDNSYLTNNSIKNSRNIGILVLDSNNTTIRDTVVDSNLGDGIYVEFADNTDLTNNTIRYNRGSGIYLSHGGYTRNSLIINNIIQNNYDGIVINYGVECSINGNSVLNSTYFGITLDHSVNSSVAHNKLTSNLFNIEGDILDHFLMDEFEDNTINGRTIIYWQNEDSKVAPLDAGQVFLVNSKLIEISGLHLFNIHVFYSTQVEIYNNSISGDLDTIISLYQSNDSQIYDNIITTEYVGISLTNANSILVSSNNLQNSFGANTQIFTRLDMYGITLLNTIDSQVQNNHIANFRGGIVLSNSISNNINSNIIANSRNVGISIFHSDLNEIMTNVVFTTVFYALEISDSAFNVISWNDFINSRALCIEEFCSQALVYSSGNEIKFNYWSDWTSPDNNFDCIVDNKYPLEPFDEEIRRYDRYPISQPISKSNAMDNKFCSQRAEFSFFVQENKTAIYIGSSLLLILVIFLLVRRIIKRRRKKPDEDVVLYPE